MDGTVNKCRLNSDWPSDNVLRSQGINTPTSIHCPCPPRRSREKGKTMLGIAWVFYFFEFVFSSSSFGLDSAQMSHYSPRTQVLGCPCRLSSAISCCDTLDHWASRFMITALGFLRIHQSGRALAFRFAEGSAGGSQSPCNRSLLGSVTG